MSVWKPIAEAPKDGTPVDLWCRGSMGPDGKPTYRRAPSCWSNGWEWKSPTDGDWEYSGGRLTGLWPEFFMEIPSGPRQ